MRLLKNTVCAAALVAAANVNAMIVVDQSPDAIGLSPNHTAANTAQGPNFLFRFTVGATTLTGVDIYSDCNSYGCPVVSLGKAVVVKLTGDSSGAPDIATLASFNTTISAVDSLLSSANPSVQRFHANFNQAVGAGSYWIGLSGDNSEIGLSFQVGRTGQSPWLLAGDALSYDLSDHTGSFNVHAVPEPANWALMVAGLGMIGTAMRRRKAAEKA